MTQRSGLRIIAAQLLIHILPVLHRQVGGACQTAKQKLKHDLKPPAHLYSDSQPGAKKKRFQLFSFLSQRKPHFFYLVNRNFSIDMKLILARSYPSSCSLIQFHKVNKELGLLIIIRKEYVRIVRALSSSPSFA